MRVLKLKTGMKKRTKLGLALEESAKEILAHIKDEKKLATRRADEVDVMRISKEARMSDADQRRRQFTR